MKKVMVTLIIPCRNEEKFIASCLDSLLANDYPKESLEIFVLDGMSEDKTREIVEKYCSEHPFIRLIDNPQKNIPVALNIGIEHARGELIMKTDAHSTYPGNYISDCVRYLQEYEADNVGGVVKIMPGADTAVAHAIVAALSHPFGSGNAYVKIGVSQPTWADTAAFGCYKREVFQKIGVFNEDLSGSSDMDFNTRLRAAGMRILLIPQVVIRYYADSNLKDFWMHNFSDGVWATYVLKFKSKAPSVRHLIPLFFVLAVLGSMMLSILSPKLVVLLVLVVCMYGLANIMASLHVVIKKKQFLGFLWLPIIFFVRHFAHGLGALVGLVFTVFPGYYWKGRRTRQK